MLTRNMITAILLLASTIPALADGKEQTIAVVNATIAEAQCGLPTPTSAKSWAAASIQYSGLSEQDWVDAVGDMATTRTNQMYANRSIGGFCVEMARIYGGVR